jgi:hypothetical protein
LGARLRGGALGAATAALVALVGTGLGGCDQAKDDLGEALTGESKVAAVGAGALEAELSIVAKEVASWYTSAGEDPKVQVSGGSYYICGASESDCASAGTVISGASQGTQIALARLGATTWCLQGSNGQTQSHVSADSGVPESGPC